MLTEDQKHLIWTTAVNLCDGYNAAHLPEAVKSVKEAYLSLYDPSEAEREKILTAASEQLQRLGK